MDYEFQIRLHEKGLHAITTEVAGQLNEIAANQLQLQASHAQLTADLAVLTQNVNTLVHALLREHPNGNE
jgi:hypothetical protein